MDYSAFLALPPKVRVTKHRHEHRWSICWYSPTFGLVRYWFDSWDAAILTADAIANR